jgi:hypothetical protein
VIVMRTVILIA